jgi:hypothetical protein
MFEALGSAVLGSGTSMPVVDRQLASPEFLVLVDPANYEIARDDVFEVLSDGGHSNSELF